MGSAYLCQRLFQTLPTVFLNAVCIRACCPLHDYQTPESGISWTRTQHMHTYASICWTGGVYIVDLVLDLSQNIIASCSMTAI